MWLVDVEVTTALEYFDPVFPVSNFASSGDVRFGSVFFIQFSWGDIPGYSPPGFDVAPIGWGTTSIPSSSLVSYVARSGTFLQPLGVLLARVSIIPPSIPVLSHFVIVSIFLQSSRFPFSLAPVPSLICGSDSSRACRSRHSL